MSQGVEVVGLYVRDQDEALAFYVEKVGFKVHTDVRNGDYRWLTVQHRSSPRFNSACLRRDRRCLMPLQRSRCAPSWPKARCRRWCWS
jgi:hypothetical protein